MFFFEGCGRGGAALMMVGGERFSGERIVIKDETKQQRRG